MKKKTVVKMLSLVLASSMLIMTGGTVNAEEMSETVEMFEEAPLYGAGIAGTPIVKEPSLEYSCHIQNDGNLPIVSSGMIGGNGRGLRMEQLTVTLKNAPSDSYITLRTHIQDKGWTNYSTYNGQPMGTTGQSKAIECIQASLKGSIANEYKLYYRVHVQELGNLAWVEAGNKAGSEGCSVAIEGVEFKLVKKTESGPATSNAAGYFKLPELTALAHISNVGDVRYKADANGVLTIGTTGQGKAIEGLDVNLTDILSTNQGITQRLHLSNVGWESKFTSGFSGTRGQSRRAEAAEFALNGNVAKLFDVQVQGHVQNIGWQQWAKTSCGTTGKSLRLEAIKIKLVRKTQSAGIASSGVINGTNATTNNTIGSPVPTGCRFSMQTQDGSWYGYHDINKGVSTSTPVYALCDGVVTYKQAYTTYSGVKKLTSYGNFIEFTSSNKEYTAKYCHLSKFVGANQIISSAQTVKASGSTGTYTIATKNVKKGEIIGYVGTTGNSSGVHLHFELRKNGTRINPVSVISGLV